MPADPPSLTVAALGASRAPRDPCAPQPRTDFCPRTREAAQAERARRDQAPQEFGARRIDQQEPRSPGAAVQVGSGGDPEQASADRIEELKTTTERSLDRLDAYLQALKAPADLTHLWKAGRKMIVPDTAAFSISRDLKAPRALVYEVQTDAKHLANWLSPEGFKTIHAKMDFRVGGTYHYGLEGPDGMQMWGLQRFREIVPNEKIVLVQSFSDKDGGLARHPRGRRTGRWKCCRPQPSRTLVRD